MIYNRKNILSYKLNSSVQLRKLSRTELFSRLQLIRKLEPITNAAYRKVEEEKWREQTDDSPHGHPWHVSFHASQFPGDDPMACPRQSLYRMADFAPPEPTSRWLRALASAGKGIEVDLVRAWYDAGILLSAGPDEEIQTGFELPEAWLTSSVDAVLLPKGWNKPLVVEVKTKWQRVIDDMKLGKKGPDQAHINQLKTQLGFVRLYQDQMWPGLDPVTHGYVYYLSRDNPSDTAEFRVDYDEKFFNQGVERLKQFKGFFLEDVLPEINPSKKHPMGWRWSYEPCKYCPAKKICQTDFKSGVTNLSDSTGIKESAKIREHYDFEAAKRRVLKRWEGM